MPSDRISAEEVNARILAGEPIVFLDNRNPTAWAQSNRKIPGAIRVPSNDVETHLDEIDPASTVVTYCTWPNEGSSARVAQILRQAGYPRVFTLRGGFDAWVAAGYPLEEKAEAA